MDKSIDYVYIVQCADGSYYTGSTTDLAKLITEHEIGADPKAYTFNRRPVKLVQQDAFSSPDQAFRAERQIKGWSRKKKEALIRNDWNAIHKIVKMERKNRESKNVKYSERRVEQQALGNVAARMRVSKVQSLLFRNPLRSTDIKQMSPRTGDI